MVVANCLIAIFPGCLEVDEDKLSGKPIGTRFKYRFVAIVDQVAHLLLLSAMFLRSLSDIFSFLAASDCFGAEKIKVLIAFFHMFQTSIAEIHHLLIFIQELVEEERHGLVSRRCLLQQDLEH